MKELAGRVAAITGAGSGIGRALALELSRRGAGLSLSDIDEVGLLETASLCEGRGVKVSSQRLDVADRAAVHAWSVEVVADHGKVNLVVNNAGVSIFGTVQELATDEIAWLMNVNFWGVVYGTKAFLPHLENSGEGHVVNLSSVFGLISVPSQSAYNSAKFAVRGFTDALRIELDAARSCVSSTTVHPGGIRTNIARNARIDPTVAAASHAGGGPDAFDKVARTSAETAAVRILWAVEHNRRRVLIGHDAKVIDLMSRLPAGWYQRAFAAGARRLL